MTDHAANSPTVLLSIKDVCARVSLARSTVYRLADEGKFPRPVEITPGRVAWVEAEVADWIRARIAAGRKSAA